MYKHILIPAVIFFSACNSNTATTTKKINATPTKKMAPPVTGDDKSTGISGCYMGTLQRDTFAAHLMQHGNNISGKLVFDNYEKDGSSGKVTGKLEGNILKLFYNFSSEGMNSVMEVYFKYEEDKLVRGIGEMNNNADTVFFINPAALQYNGSVLKKIPCESVASKYK